MHNSLIYSNKQNYLYSKVNQQRIYKGFQNNQYYKQKSFDDHRLQRIKLQKPGFLIKQQKIYPEFNNQLIISQALYNAQKINNPLNLKNRFYTSQSQQHRIRIDGRNPFLKDEQYLKQQKLKYLTKTPKSRIQTNPNLGVRSYQVLDLRQNQESNKKSKSSRPNPFQQNYEEQANSLNKQWMIEKQQLSNRKSKRSKLDSNYIYNYNQIKEQNSSDEELFYDRPEIRLKSSIAKKTVSKLITSDVPPLSITHKGKTFFKLT